MSGFFSKQDLQSTVRKDGKKYSCVSCGLYHSGCNSPKMEPKSGDEVLFMNVFDSPTVQDDNAGQLLTGAYGNFYYKMFHDAGFNINENCVTTSAVKCMPVDRKKKENRPATNYEIDCCRIHLKKVIKEHKPKVIFAFGMQALYALIGDRWKKDFNQIGQWRGFAIPDQDLKCFIVPMLPPDYIDDKKPHNKKVMELDFKKGFNIVNNNTEFPVYVPPKITYLKRLDALNEIKAGTNISFDYETTGLKPHLPEQKIICCSVATDANNVFVFMMPKKESLLEPFIDLMRNKSIGKKAHNIKFEDNWTWIKLGVRVKNWKWCSMLAAHIIDNRKGITSLKFQTYVNFGVVDYASEVSKWLEGTEQKNANSLNRIEKFIQNERNKETLMEYCALDSIFEYRLSELQENIMQNAELPF